MLSLKICGGLGVHQLRKTDAFLPKKLLCSLKKTTSRCTFDFYGSDSRYGEVTQPLCSKLAYNPDRRWEIWRFFTYAFMHANTGHLFRNIVGLLIVGIPLEMSHKTSRVAAVFSIGVVGGALASSILTSDQRPLTGASGVERILLFISFWRSVIKCYM
jgi:membrane associated rhomboid family serine protease